MKKIFTIFKKFIFSAFVLYGYNLVMSTFSLIIPINVITVSTVTFLGLPGLLGLIAILLILF